ncbi:MAG: chemotaxis protein CheW [Chloroflexi bacterium]|nr:chemotaxis protein CheW [Chloroflexota bacterium]
MTKNNMQLEVPVLLFTLGDQEYAMLIEDVLEVAAMVEITHVADPRPEILGVVNRHGTVLWMLDLRRIFGQSAQSVDITTLFIVAQRGAHQLGLVVDEVRQVEYVDLSKLQTSARATELIHGILSHGERLIQLLALSPLLERYAPVAD